VDRTLQWTVDKRTVICSFGYYLNGGSVRNSIEVSVFSGYTDSREFISWHSHLCHWHAFLLQLDHQTFTQVKALK